MFFRPCGQNMKILKIDVYGVITVILYVVESKNAKEIKSRKVKVTSLVSRDENKCSSRNMFITYYKKKSRLSSSKTQK